MRTLLLIFALLSCVNPATLWAAAPNIVFILADDMGYGDLKAYNPNSKIQTPHLDQLAADGVVFTDAHSGGSTCVPSRHSLITGRFAARQGRLNWRAGPVIARGQLTFASVLRDQGYRTAMVGKWHQGFAMKAPGVFDYERPLLGGPVDCGF
ncbi:MAG: sulfatase-like hydrolase/transferase, partial [Planctomycetaceae bacterium]|nr:sulfatase-like hydrolase/transferase [Planctomycetaceae bacterium]